MTTDETTWADVRATWREAWHLFREGVSLKLIYWALCVAPPTMSDRTVYLFAELAQSFMETDND